VTDLAAVQSSSPSTRISADMWRAAWMVTSIFMLSNSPTPLYVVWQSRFGFSSGMLTVIFALYIVGLLGTLLVAGQLSDRYGRKWIIVPGILAALVACGLFATASSIVTLAIGRLLTGMAVGAIVSAGMAAVADLGGFERRRQAALLASVAMVLGAGLGPLLAGTAAQELTKPIVTVFGIEFLVLLSALIIALRLPIGRPAKTGSVRLHLPSVPAKNLWHVACGVGVFGPGITGTSFVLALGPSLLARLLQVRSPLLAGGMACAMFLTATSIQIAARRLSLRTIFAGGTTATTMSMVALCVAVHASSVTFLIAAALFAGAGQGLGQLGGLTLIGLHVPDTRRAEAIAVMNIGGYLPAGLLPVLTGYAIDFLGLANGATGFAVALALIALGLGGMVFRSLRYERK